MKIYPNQLPHHLKKGLTPIYLISGDIPALVQEATQTIHKFAKTKGFLETLRYQVDSTFNWAQLDNLLEHSSLFETKQYIEIKVTNLPLSTQGIELLKHYAEHPQTDKLLILITQKLDTKTQKMSWVTKMMEKATYIPIWPMDFGKYIQWIQSKIEEQGLNVDNKAIQLLAESTEGNYNAALQMIENLSTYSPKSANKIGIDEIADLTLPSYQYDLFNWVDACLLGHTDRMIKIFYSLKQAHVEPTLLLWSITQEIRKLIHLYFYKAEHKNLSVAFKEQGIWEKKQPLFQKALMRHNLKSLESLLEKAHQVDKILKGAKIGDPWDPIMNIGFQLSLA